MSVNLGAVMFDMDGLLLDTERACLESFVDTRQSFGLPGSPETFLQCVGLRGDRTREIISASLNGRTGYGAFNAEWDRRIDLHLSGTIPRKPGARRLVQLLEAKGIPVGVATSTDTDRATAYLEKSGLLAHVAHVVGGDQVENHKPDPEVYRTLAARLGTVASACIAFEDSEPGTRAAIASGARTIQVPDLIAPSDEMQALSHVIAPSLLEGARLAGLVSLDDLR